ncbi:MAG: HPr-rel-A system PqqD family peptide chaperone [Deltaproteobacteria bacterium]|nr:HPr-rel-A system PqqD family peptide chaperone [Deltaproteobacteria bacterium]
MLWTAALRRVSSLPFQKLDNEVLVVDPRTREVHLLNATATRIWDLLQDPLTGDELVAALTEEFDAPAGALRADVETLLTELGSKGLVGADAVLEPHLASDGTMGEP